jgi:protocatechuate 3,4-dioxygenase beta subunit
MKTAHFSIYMLIFSFLSVNSLAQTATTARISGRVTDAQGAVIVGANVELTDTTTGAKRTTITNDEGSYVFASLVPGIYNMTGMK